MLVITIIYALISVLGIGSILNPILKRCDVLSSSEEEDAQDKIEEQVENGQERKKCCSSFKKTVAYLNEIYFAPLFIKS